MMKNDWSDGYVSEIDYTFGYYSELNPANARMALLNNGILPPNFQNACELGFGQGVSININAAASNTKWYGTDFNPSQAGFAKDLANSYGCSQNLSDESFLEFCNRDDLPDFDFIGLHGIWSWISDENRFVLVDFIKRKLTVGGVVYVSYNTLPGWSGHAPIRQFLNEHVSRFGARADGIANNISDALKFAENLFTLKSKYTENTIGSKDRFEKLKSQNASYLAHEYFNKDWQPMYFHEVANWLEPAKLTFACSANYLDKIDILNFDAEGGEFLNSISDLNFRETARDFLVNQGFRKDYWIRGRRNLNKIERTEYLKKEKVALITPREKVATKAKGMARSADLPKNIYDPILDRLANYAPISLEELSEAVRGKDISLEMTIEAVNVLIGVGSVSPLDDSNRAPEIKQVDKLNRKIISLSASGREIRFMASPSTCGAIVVSSIAQSFLNSYMSGRQSIDDLAQDALDLLVNTNKRIQKDQKTIDDIEESRSELKSQAKDFLQSMVPFLEGHNVLR